VTEKLQKIIMLGCYVLANGKYWITTASWVKQLDAGY
jgi:hypothetical protein